MTKSEKPKTSSPFLNRRNKFVLRKEHKESKSTLPDMTVPSEAMSIKEILTRFTRGLDLPPSRSTPVYNPNPSHDSVDEEKLVNSDLADQEEYRNQVKADIAEFEAKVKAEKAAKAKKQQDSKAVVAVPEPSSDPNPTPKPPTQKDPIPPKQT